MSEKKRKILYSPSFGAGWTSWNSGYVAKYMLDYAPIIEAVERGEVLSPEHPLVEQMEKEIFEKFGEQHICVLAAGKLAVALVNGRVRINEYDGSESVEEEGEFTKWM